MSTSAATFARQPRIASIDVFRALTMFFMVFVNDFPSHFPHWLGHAVKGEDFLGFSDIIFPAFLFVMGMSIPFAIENRFAKGDNETSIFGHILMRATALLVMGLFSVNLGAGLSRELWISRPVFSLTAIACYFMIWNAYPKATSYKKWLFTALQVIGIIILIYLAFLFRDRSGGVFQIRWWGILGLIGWSYAICAFIYLFIRNNLKYQSIAWIVIVAYSMLGASKCLGTLHGIIPGNGTFHAFTMTGILLSTLFYKLSTSEKWSGKLIPLAAGIGAALMLTGFFTRQFWIISKLGDTPTWMFICSGISSCLYAFLYWLTDVKGKAHWFKVIKPAGTATLTCFLIPSVVYAIFTLTKFSFPAYMTAYPQGLLKCAAISFLCIGITALLGKIGIKMKI
ncbi:MAG: DUF5009 domain-containing protein [Bacteroidales bacterium]|nr:DUF5009 domain-containing protein [Bacteroidales bacterium]MCL2738984.1 DUF5009 domain-containing protein [Bacteroidales bacterium]